MQSWHRRDFLRTCASTMAALPCLARATSKRFHIAELKMVRHAALDADERGFEAGLTQAGLTPSFNLHIERFDAQGDAHRVKQLAQHISQAKFDLIHTIAALPTQHILAKVQYTPVVFSSVTDLLLPKLLPQHLGQSIPHTRNMTGVSDQWPVDLQFHVYASLAPHAKIWGTRYNPAEANSAVHLQHLHTAAHARGVQLIAVPVHHPNDVPAAALDLVSRVQAITITSDNTSSARLEDVALACNTYRCPLFAGDIDSVERGAVAAYGLNYFLVGFAAGRKAALILRGTPANALPGTRIDKFSLALNLKAAQLQGVELSASVQARANRILR